MPSITQLEYILAVHKHRHFGRAASALGISQPTLSTQIQKAESELGLTIFDRQARPIALTLRGRALIDRAHEVIGAHENLMRLASGESQELAGAFSIGIIPTLAPYVLPWFLGHFVDHYPRVELSVYERPTDELLAEIALNRLDAAILATPLGESSIIEHKLFYDPFYVYAQADETLLRKPEIEVADLDAEKLWLLEDGHCFRAQVINFCGVQERRHLGSVRFAGGSLETIRHLIDASEGYTLIPETYARTLPRSVRLHNVRAFEARTPIREVSLVHHRRSWKRDLLQALEQSIVATVPRSLKQVDEQGEIVPIRPRELGPA